MTELFNEGFEGTGYEETGWSESGVADEDYATSNIGSPSEWGSQCLRCNKSGSGSLYARNNPIANTADIFYFTFEFYVASHSLTLGSHYTNICRTRGSGWASSTMFRLDHDGSNVNLECDVYHDATANTVTLISSISTATRYYAGFYWNVTADEWAVRAGTSVPTSDIDSGSLTSTHQEHLQDCFIGVETTNQSIDICIDNIIVDDAAWVWSSSPATGGSVPAVLMQMGEM